jgi:glycosyltransferase involved in cell wall biosynthesis
MNENDKTGINEIKKIVKELIVIPVNDLRSDSLLFFVKRLQNLFFLRKAYYISDEYSKTFDIRLQSIIKNANFDYIHFLSDFSGQYLLSQTEKHKIILGPIDDVVQTLFEIYSDTRGIKNKIITYLNYVITKHFFVKIITQAGTIYFHSREDLERVTSRLNQKTNSFVLPVATEIEKNIFEPVPVESKSIVFVGGMGVSFNQDAVLYFYNHILPLIQAKIPKIKFYIVGNSPSQEILKLDDGKSIIVTGAVDDVEPYIRKANVYVSPLQKGTGIKTKMVEAMKMGKAIVATNKALQGLWEIDREAIRIENDPIHFANAVIEILNNDELRLEMERKTIKLYENYYDFEKVVPITLNIYSNNIKPNN